MNKFLGLLLITILLIISFELFLLVKIKPQISIKNQSIVSPTKLNIRTDWEPWSPSEIKTYKNKSFGLISAATIKINQITLNTIDAELKDKNQIKFQYDQSVKYFDRKETKQTLVEQIKNSKGFAIEVGKIYLVEWMGEPKERNKLWRISRLVL